MPCVATLGKWHPNTAESLNMWDFRYKIAHTVWFFFLHFDVFRGWANDVSMHKFKLKYVLECFSKLQPA